MAVFSDEPRPVDWKDDVQILYADVMNDLIESPLQKGRVDGGHWLHALASQASGKCNRVLLGDADVEVPLWDRLVELVESGAFRHRRRDADNRWIVARQLYQSIREDV